MSSLTAGISRAKEFATTSVASAKSINRLPPRNIENSQSSARIHFMVKIKQRKDHIAASKNFIHS